MRVIDLPTFHTMKPGTIFQKTEPNIFEPVEVFEGSLGEDFVTSPLGLPEFEDVHSSDDISAGFDKLLAGESVPLQWGDASCRDGLFEDGQLFAVYERQDVERLIAYLQQQLARAY